MIRRHYVLLLALLCAAHLTGCKASQPPQPAEPALPTVAVPVGLAPDTTRTRVQVAPPALLPRITDAIGLSTPAGRARRQARRDVAASVPRSLGKGAVYAVNSRVVTAYKAKAPTVQADSGATVSNAAEGSQQQAVKGNGNQLTADKHDTTQQAAGVGATIAKAITGPLGVVLGLVAAGAVVYLLYLIWAFIPRRRDNTA